MNEASLAIILTAQDQATPQLKNFSTTLTSNKAAIRELAMGVSYLGMTFLGLGIALEKSNNAFGQSVGQMLIMVGSIMSAIGAAAQFVSAVAKMVNALKILNIQQIITQALMGPAGWITLGVGAAVATAAVAGTVAYSRAETKSEQKVTIENKIYLDSKQIAGPVRKQFVLNQQQNATSGIR